MNLAPSEAFIVELPVLIKASVENGRRLVSVEASNEAVDKEGDIIMQSALLDAAPNFLKNGHIDIDHISEIGDRYGIPNPSSYIIGRPTDVKDLGDGRTEVIAEIFRSNDGVSNPAIRKCDEFWESLQTTPPVVWKSSIYGFPKSGMIQDCRNGLCSSGATRFLVRGIDWRSLAFTRNPINDSIKGIAKVVTAKAFIEEILKASPQNLQGYQEHTCSCLKKDGAFMPAPIALSNLSSLMQDYSGHVTVDCPWHDAKSGVNLTSLRNHYTTCLGMPYDQADLYAHALMHKILRS